MNRQVIIGWNSRGLKIQVQYYLMKIWWVYRIHCYLSQISRKQACCPNKPDLDIDVIYALQCIKPSCTRVSRHQQLFIEHTCIHEHRVKNDEYTAKYTLSIQWLTGRYHRDFFAVMFTLTWRNKGFLTKLDYVLKWVSAMTTFFNSETGPPVDMHL